jgi:hypothetical protein
MVIDIPKEPFSVKVSYAEEKLIGQGRAMSTSLNSELFYQAHQIVSIFINYFKLRAMRRSIAIPAQLFLWINFRSEYYHILQCLHHN